MTVDQYIPCARTPRANADRAQVVPILTDVFVQHGFEGASLSIITQRTGLGKGSLYHFFPGGKAEMAAAVLAEIDDWFEQNVFTPLRSLDPGSGISAMLKACEDHYASGRRACVVGLFALGDARDRFAERVRTYFARWVEALSEALQRGGRTRETARGLAEYGVASMQGAIVLARALDDPVVFSRACGRLQTTLTRDR